MTATQDWINWTTRLQAIAQNGLTFSRDDYDIKRYTEIREIVAEMLAGAGNCDLPVIRSLLAADSGYTTPKVDVRGVVFRGDSLLLVKERSDGLWTLPGGWADVCASPAENVVREMFEESGFRTRTQKLLAVFDRGKHPHEPQFPFHVYKMFIQCEIVCGEATISNETDEIGFFAEAALPPLSVTRVTPWQIQRMFEHHRNPNLPTDFDSENHPESGSALTG